MTTKETKRLYAALYAHWLRALHSMLIDACLATPDDETRQLLMLRVATFENLIESIPRELLIFSLVRSDGDNPAEVHVHASDLSGELFALYRRPVQHLGLTEKQALRHFTTLGFPVVDPAKAAEAVAAQLLGGESNA